MVFRNVRDAPGRIEDAPVNDVYAFFQPNALRSTQAVFDPAKRNSPDVMARTSAARPFPAVPSRPFEVDYLNGIHTSDTPADLGGRLTHDMDGRPIRRGVVAGRRVVGGDEVALTQAELDALAEAASGVIPARSSRSLLPGKADGTVSRVVTENGVTYPIRIADDLDEEGARRTLAHEVGHVIDMTTPPLRQNSVQTALKRNFSTGADGVVKDTKLTLPQHQGYTSSQAEEEMIAEGLRAYLTNPSYLKSTYPELAKRLREMVNTAPAMAGRLVLNAAPPLAVGGALLASQGGDARAAEASEPNFFAQFNEPDEPPPTNTGKDGEPNFFAQFEEEDGVPAPPPLSRRPGEAQAAPPQKRGEAESFFERENRRGSDRAAALLQGPTFGFGDEIAGGIVGAGSAGLAAAIRFARGAPGCQGGRPSRPGLPSFWRRMV